MSNPAPNLNRMLARGGAAPAIRGKRIALTMFAAGRSERDLLDALSEQPKTGTARRDIRPGATMVATSPAIPLEVRQ